MQVSRVDLENSKCMFCFQFQKTTTTKKHVWFSVYFDVLSKEVLKRSGRTS